MTWGKEDTGQERQMPELHTQLHRGPPFYQDEVLKSLKLSGCSSEDGTQAYCTKWVSCCLNCTKSPQKLAKGWTWLCPRPSTWAFF
jgi:hypothetical protein